MVDETSDISDQVVFFCMYFVFFILFIKIDKNSPNPNLQMTGNDGKLIKCGKTKTNFKKRRFSIKKCWIPQIPRKSFHKAFYRNCSVQTF